MHEHRVIPVSRELHSDDPPLFRCRACGEQHLYPDDFSDECPQVALFGEAS